jgi:hypothetical protein
MDEDRADKMAEIKDRVARGQYRVDAQAVADAILRRMAEAAKRHALRDAPGRPPASPLVSPPEC